MDTPGNRPESAQDHYATLGVSRDASPDDIKKSYRALITKYHPDRNHGPDAEWKTKEINEAYSILSDPEKKSNYDHPRPPSYMHDHDDHVRGKGYHSSQDGYTYKTYTWTYGENKKAENNADPAMAQILLRIAFKVIVLLIALWLILHFFVLFIIIVFIVMLIYLASQVMGQIVGFFFNRR